MFLMPSEETNSELGSTVTEDCLLGPITKDLENQIHKSELGLRVSRLSSIFLNCEHRIVMADV